LLNPHFVAPARFDDPAAALEQVRAIYDGSISHLRDHLQRFVGGESFSQRVRGMLSVCARAYRYGGARRFAPL